MRIIIEVDNQTPTVTTPGVTVQTPQSAQPPAPATESAPAAQAPAIDAGAAPGDPSLTTRSDAPASSAGADGGAVLNGGAAPDFSNP